MRRRYDIIPGVGCLIICALLVLLALPKRNDLVIAGGPPAVEPGVGDESEKSSMIPLPSDNGIASEESEPASSSAVSSDGPDLPSYISPVDFASLQLRCPDIYSWIQIPGTNIDYPVVQSPKSDDYYLRRDIDGNYATAGSLFTEGSYNGLDYLDPVTVIYGHHMRSGEMFGHLQEYYADADSFAALREIIIYRPDKELHYSVFAAVPYSNEHVLYKFSNFKRESALYEFLETLREARGFGKNLNEETMSGLRPEDRLLILSTCLDGNRQKRYLVIAKLERTVP